MAWVTPITDRVSGAVCTVTDMNRIAGNLDWLATELTAHQLYTGATVQKTSYTLEYVTLANWQDILNVLNAMVAALNLTDVGEADETTTYTNFNTVESITLAIYEWLQLLLSQANANHYAGDDIYVQGDNSPFTGGLAI